MVNKRMKQQQKVILGVTLFVGILLVINFGGFNFLSIFILPSGEYRSNSDCSFITNIEGEGFDDYRSSSNDHPTGVWIAVDSQGDGNLEGYFPISVSPLNDLDDVWCDQKEGITTTPSGLKVIKAQWFNELGRIGICSPDRFKIEPDGTQVPIKNWVKLFEPYNFFQSSPNIFPNHLDNIFDESDVVVQCDLCETGTEKCDGSVNFECVVEAG